LNDKLEHGGSAECAAFAHPQETHHMAYHALRAFVEAPGDTSFEIAMREGVRSGVLNA
jgi:hypothetical protein